MTAAQHPAASHHLPWFLTAPGDSDILFTITTIIVLLVVFGLGTVFFRLHSLPERLGHKKLQFEIVAVLCLLSLFTHIHLFWVFACCWHSSTCPISRRLYGAMRWDSLGRLADDGKSETPQAAPKPAPPEPGA